MLIIDAHLDLAWNALQWNRDLTCSVYTIRNMERTNKLSVPGYGMNTVALPEMRQGKVAVSFVTLLARSTGHPVPNVDFGSLAQAYGIAQGQMAYYYALEAEGQCRLLSNVEQLDQHINEWLDWDRAPEQHGAAPPLGFIISMESADSILRPEQLEEWWQGGLRILGPAHYGPGRYAGGNDTELGLTELGPPLLSEMQRLGMILDMTHLSDQAFWQALEHYSGPVLASHSNCRALVPNQRQLSDAQLKSIIEREGVVGVALIALMLQLNWVLGKSSNRDITLETVVDHIDHVCQLAGSSRHVAIGTDLDGGAGLDTVPSDLDTIADLQKIPELLARRGYTERDLENISYGNWLRLLRGAWGSNQESN